MLERKRTRGPLGGVVTLLMNCVSVHAVGGSATSAEPSKDMRAKIADLHQQMATCLRSDQSIETCRFDMMKACQQLTVDQSCVVMGMGAPHRRMKGPPAGAPE